MRYILFLILFLACNPISKEEIPVVSVDSTYVSHASSIKDCGTSPYTLFDGAFSDDNLHKEVQLRFVKIVEEKEPERIDIEQINRGVKRLNDDFEKYNFSFVAREVIIEEDRTASREGIRSYQKHASRYAEIGYINIFIYPSNLDGGFSGAAVGIPSTSIAIKEFYLATSTISHEIGHALFGLYHTHTLDKTGIKNSYETGDLVCGTPYADFYSTSSIGYLGRVAEDCTYIGPLGDLTQEEHNANISNIMSYSLTYCRKEVTPDQIARGKFIISNSQNHKQAIEIKQ